MKIGVLGCGRWGSFLAWYLDRIGHEVCLYGRESSENLKTLMETRTNGLVTLPESISLTSCLSRAGEAETVVISIASQGLAGLTAQLSALGSPGRTLVLCMKGLESETGRRLSRIAAENSGPSDSVAVWLGPGHVQEFCRGVPNCMVIDSEDPGTVRRLVAAFSGPLIRFYYGRDLIGNEIGAASKNVIGIAAGLLDGLGLPTLKGALMSRGTREIARLIRAMGGNELSAYGLCHLGDYEATVFSEYSHNRRFGQCLAQGLEYNLLAEGFYTAKALAVLEKEYCVDLPICRGVYDILYEGRAPREVLESLLDRDLKMEF